MATNTFNEILADEIEFMKSALKKTAEELTFQIQAAYESAIDKFYADYSPHTYGRTQSTYFGSSGAKYFKKNIYPVGDMSYMGGIVVDSFFIGQPYKANATWVFNRTFEQGIHGYTPGEAKAWSSRWKEKQGPHLSADNRLVFPPTKRAMKPSPMVLLNKDFRKIASHKNIDSLFNSFYNS